MRTARLLAAVLAAAGLMGLPAQSGWAATAPATPIRHLVVLMQSGHSFDNYFGTYPGADGIPNNACLPANTREPKSHPCVKPFHLGNAPAADLDHGTGTWKRQYDHGRMDGFVSAYRRLGVSGVAAMGYYNQLDIPYYWRAASHFVLFDHFFSSAPVGQKLNRFWWVAGRATPGGADKVPAGGYGQIPTIFDRLQAAGVSWKMYVQNYDPHVSFRTPHAKRLSSQISRVPLVDFARFVDNPQLASHLVDGSTYYTDLARGTLPAVSFMTTSGSSESPPGPPQAGEQFVYHATSALAMSRYWGSSAMLWTYDGWGGWYDHLKPPAGYGFRVPAVLVSAYARQGYVDHVPMDYTAILSFIEGNWGLKPLSERDAKSPGLSSAFNFAQPGRPAVLLALNGTAKPAAGANPWVVYGVYVGELGLVAIAVGLAIWGDRRRRRRRAEAT